MPDAPPPYDSFLLVSFGGPEGPDEVMPFLENVLRGRNVPRERMLQVAEHYGRFGGVSPINAQNRELIAAIGAEFGRSGVDLPIYWGNRNWHPLLEETLRAMGNDGRRRAVAFFTNMFSCYSGCRQYREDIAAARQRIGGEAPIVDKLRFGFNHPGFIEAMVARVQPALAEFRAIEPSDINPKVVQTKDVTLLFTAHSIPMSMAEGSDYERQLRESCRLVANEVVCRDWQLVFQSRSGPPTQRWLEPDVCDEIGRLHASGNLRGLVIVPIGFVSDHMEVIYDLDQEAAFLCRELAIPMRRASTVGTHPAFVRMIRELVIERLDPGSERPALGKLGPWHDVCPQDCCLYGTRGSP